MKARPACIPLNPAFQEIQHDRSDPFESFDQFLPEMLRRMKLPLHFSDEPNAEIRIDITEKDKDYAVRAEIPGAKKEDMRIRVDGNFVSIAADIRKDHEEKSGDRVVLTETYRGNVSRGFSLAHEIDAKHVIAKLSDGVLNLTLPKREGSASKTIEIQ